MKKEFKFEFDVYDSIDDMEAKDAELLKKAIEATKNSYAPYSHFHVAASARMHDGEIISGTNQENASFPVGICAERTMLSVAATLYPNQPIDTIAVTYDNLNGESNHPISPCGMCRQSLQEYEARMEKPIRIILGGKEGKVFVLDSVKRLLPLCFTADDMKQ